MSRPKNRLVRLLAAPIAASVALGMAACAPITTQREYAASDGIRVVVTDDVVIENFMLISKAEGEPGSIQGAIRNDGADTKVSITTPAMTQTIQVDAGTTVLLGGPTGIESVIDPVTVAPGATMPVQVSTPDSDATEVPVPVISADRDEYKDYAPNYSSQD